MKKKIALIVSLLMLGFLFCFGMNQVCAEETPTDTTPTTTETTTETTNDNDEAVVDEAVSKVTSLVDYLKTFTADDLKGWITGIIAYLSANLLVIVAMAIKLMMNYTKKVKDSEAYNEALAKMSDAQATKTNEFMDKMYNAYQELYNQVVKFAKTEDSQQRAKIIESAQAQSKEMANIVEDLKNSIGE